MYRATAHTPLVMHKVGRSNRTAIDSGYHEKGTATARDETVPYRGLLGGSCTATWRAVARRRGCHSATDPRQCFVEPPPGTAQSALYRVSGLGHLRQPERTRHRRASQRRHLRRHDEVPGEGSQAEHLYYMQRAAEFPITVSSADGSASGPTARRLGRHRTFAGATWVTFPKPYTDQGPIKTMATDAAGDASIEFEFFSPRIKSGHQVRRGDAARRRGHRRRGWRHQRAA